MHARNCNRCNQVVLNCDVARLLDITNYASIKLGTILQCLRVASAGSMVLWMWYTSGLKLQRRLGTEGGGGRVGGDSRAALVLRRGGSPFLCFLVDWGPAMLLGSSGCFRFRPCVLPFFLLLVDGPDGGSAEASSSSSSSCLRGGCCGVFPFFFLLLVIGLDGGGTEASSSSSSSCLRGGCCGEPPP